MKIKPFTMSLLLGLASCLLIAPTRASLTYNDGDLLLGFRATGGTGGATDYLVNLGQAQLFTNATSPIVLGTAQLGNLKADLDVWFSATWQTRVDMLWSVSGVYKFAGAGFLANTMFATNAHVSNVTLGLQDSAAWARPTSFGAGGPAGKIQSMSTTFALGNGGGSPTGATESTNSAFALIQPQANVNSYRAMMPNGSAVTGAAAYNWFGGSTGIEGNFGNGTGGVVLDFYSVQPGTSGTGDFEGTFTINNNATVTFTPAIPEPASMAAIAGGIAVLATIRRRRASL
jgi:hypothetical protein